MTRAMLCANCRHPKSRHRTASCRHAWRAMGAVTEGKAGGGAGYSTRADNGRRERLWLSPGCHLAQDALDFTGEAS